MRVIGIEIIFSVKFTILCDGTIRRKTYCHRIFYHLFIQHGKRSRHTGTYRTGVGIGSATERCGTAAEYFRLRGKLYMNFQTNYCFILFCHSKYLSVSALLIRCCIYPAGTNCVYISVILLHALLIGICRTDQCLLFEAVTDELHADRQAFGIRTAGNADTGQSRQVDGDSVDVS